MNWQFLKKAKAFSASTWERGQKEKTDFLLHLLPGGTAAILVAGGCLLSLWHPLEQIADRTLYQLRGSHKWDERVVIIAIDDGDLKAFGRFPWSRGRYATLLDVLSAAGTSVVTLDLLFSESSPEDEKLAAAMERQGQVVLARAWDRTGMPLVPVPKLQRAAIATGHVRNYKDSDGITRWIEPQNGGVPALAIAVARVYALTTEPVKMPELNRPLWVNWPGAVDGIPQYSYTDVIQGRVPAQTFKDKIVLVGVTATGIDALQTPFDNKIPASGVHLHAAVLNNLLQQNFLQRPDFDRWTIILLLAAPALSYVLTRLKTREQFLSVFGLVLGWGTLSLLLFRVGYWIPVALPIGLFSLTGAAMACKDRLKTAILLQKSEERLRHQAFYDPLTGLPNRTLFIERLHQAIQRSNQWEDYLFAVLFLDLDRFKMVNNSLGHAVGDRLLVTIAERLQACLASDRNVARLRGDEFAILLENIQDVSDATRVAEEIHQTLAAPFSFNGYDFFIKASIGIVLSKLGIPEEFQLSDFRLQLEEKQLMPAEISSLPSACDYHQPEDILRDADIAMYHAKSLSQTSCVVFDKILHARVLALLQLETDLRRAVEGQEFLVYYQPIISLSTGKITGFEALIRWQHPTRGMVSPAEFIPIAEDTGLIVPIGAWVLREACRQLRLWQQQLSTQLTLTMNVNLSGIQFAQRGLVEQIYQILQETEIEGSSIKLEITESCLLENGESATAILEELRALGIGLAIDDFGTGYSSLGRLHRLPIDTLKIDRSFISRIDDRGESWEMVWTLVTLAHNLGMDVVAEGVETAEQLLALQRLQCDCGQGYFFSKPVAAKAAMDLMVTALHFSMI